MGRPSSESFTNRGEGGHLMGYWEQTGAEILRLRERRARRPLWLRFDPTLLIAIPVAALIWGLLVWQVWDFFSR